MCKPNTTRVLFMSCIIYCCIRMVPGNPRKDETGVSTVPETENTKQDTVNIHSPNDLNTMDAMNPELIAALREINDDPSYLKPREGELVDLSQFQMDPEKLEEMIEIFDWIESELPPDDPQQIQKILNNIEQYINKMSETETETEIDRKDLNYMDDSLLLDLTVLPEYLYQVDNGVDFMKMNGVQILLKSYNYYKNNNNNNKNATLNYKILSQIIDVIGVASQNNPNAIQYVHQSNMVLFIINELNNIYLNYKNNNTRSVMINGQLINKLVFTLSCITRQSDIGLKHLQQNNGPKVLYQCGKLLSKEILKNNKEIERAFKKLLTMISDIVVLNGNNLEYSRMFLNSGKWCGFMIEKGLMFDSESVLQFINYALQRNYCSNDKMLNSLVNKLNKIIHQNTPKKKNNNNQNEEEEYYDNVLTQSTNMLIYIKKNFDIDKKTEL